MIKIVLIFCAVLFCANIIILESYQTHVSSPVITSDKTNYKQGENVIISGWINYNEEPTSDVLVRIITTNPLEIKIFDEYVTSGFDGAFSIEIPIEKDAEVGRYVVEIISQCREIHREICTHQNETITITIENESNQNKRIPDWIKNNASWWVEGTIDDKAFVGGIQFLIKEGIIQIPETTQSGTGDTQEIPAWIKNNADWWSKGLISDDDFLKGIQFMVENGIIMV